MSHIHKLIDFVVNIFIIYENKVLLIHHKQLDKWLPIGGHIELNEDPDEALSREVKEECGLNIKILSSKPALESDGTKFLYTPAFLDIHKILDTHKHIGLVYFAKAESDKFVFNKEEHKGIRWVSGEELELKELNLSPAVKFYAREALERTRTL
ncbi:NUDIX domain-containing protein [Patescibacteria group bacterium]|nr:NUDIX domain-containing protein [Patescibacteria group bacterium]